MVFNVLNAGDFHFAIHKKASFYQIASNTGIQHFRTALAHYSSSNPSVKTPKYFMLYTNPSSFTACFGRDIPFNDDV
ncbi:hypothetical protein BCON_0004g01090 [Botryotinia convoluta]|uniref:Uncharacterized protein n=1 Tax=Botryotinia convoluta TaxID=54673 RepID=A0A4Z1IUG3_9HELO|nr:hypothetical protein BCON_0004g01090 [Botryotinia convoluta]